jgi:hypothetical protein
METKLRINSVTGELDLVTESLDGSEVNVSTTNFNGNLSETDTTVQAALNTLDQVVTADNVDLQTVTDNGNTTTDVLQAAGFETVRVTGSAQYMTLYEDPENGDNYVQLKSPDSLAANVVFVLPSVTASANQVLKNDGSGNLGWYSLVFPAADGSANQLLKTDGSGQLGWATDANTTYTAGERMTLTGTEFSVRSMTVSIKVLEDGTALSTGDGKMYYTAPAVLNGYNLSAAHAAVYTVSSDGLPTVQLYNMRKTADMLSTRITIDASEFSSYTAATAHVIDTDNDDIATGDRIRVDVDVAGTGTKGLEVILTFTKP